MASSASVTAVAQWVMEPEPAMLVVGHVPDRSLVVAEHLRVDLPATSIQTASNSPSASATSPSSLARTSAGRQTRDRALRVS